MPYPLVVDIQGFRRSITCTACRCTASYNFHFSLRRSTPSLLRIGTELRRHSCSLKERSKAAGRNPTYRTSCKYFPKLQLSELFLESVILVLLVSNDGRISLRFSLNNIWTSFYSRKQPLPNHFLGSPLGDPGADGAILADSVWRGLLQT